MFNNASVIAVPPIPTVVHTGVAVSTTTLNTGRSPTRTSDRTRTAVNYSEVASKRAKSNLMVDDYPDEDLDDYMHTYNSVTEGQPAPLRSHGFQAEANQTHPAINVSNTGELELGSEDEEEAVAERWQSLFASLDLHPTVAAIAPSVTMASNEEIPEIEGAGGMAQFGMADSRLGTVSNITMKEQRSEVVATPVDRTMSRMYLLCDNAGGPRYLADQIVKQLQQEIIQNGFDPCSSKITRRDSYMDRALRKTGSPPPEAIPLSLESGQSTTVFRFPLQSTLQVHLLSSFYSDLNDLSVDISNPWGEYVNNDSLLCDFLDGTWHTATTLEYQQSKPDIGNMKIRFGSEYERV
jgi:hypothetical protein